jgi:FkbM family methyltransferase
LNFRTIHPDVGHHLNEMLTSVVYRRVVKAGDHVLDIGANEGAHTAALSSLVGPGGIVHAFEPNTQHYPKLEKLPDNVKLWPCAVGHKFSREILHIPENVDGWASLNSDVRDALPSHDFRLQPTIQVPLSSIEEIHTPRLTFIKIDVEGREKQVLEGMRTPQKSGWWGRTADGLLRVARPILVIENVTSDIYRLLKQEEFEILDFVGRDWSAGEGLPNSVVIPKEMADHLSILPNSADIRQVLKTSEQLANV